MRPAPQKWGAGFVFTLFSISILCTPFANLVQAIEQVTKTAVRSCIIGEGMAKEYLYIIKNFKVRDSLYWSNDWGWGSLKGCTKFTENEHNAFNLPVDGAWVRIFK